VGVGVIGTSVAVAVRVGKWVKVALGAIVCVGFCGDVVEVADWFWLMALPGRQPVRSSTPIKTKNTTNK
jgi:hypothetical protein